MGDTFAWVPEKIYKESIKSLPICSVDVLFFNKEKNRILLFKRSNNPAKGWYYSPGGRLWKNKDFAEMAKIQMKKELEINIDKKKLFGGLVMTEKFRNSVFSGIGTHNVNIFFGYILKEKEKEDIILDSQHEKFQWMKLDDKRIHPYVREKISRLIRM
jgi:colanic acid biosynthesis protein WcaH